MIEVEKKFILTPEQEKSLTDSAEFLGEKKFTDVYFDDVNFSLTLKDFWLRERSGKYELKISRNEESGNRVSTELETDQEILQYLNADANETISAFLARKEYRPFCSITTTRKKYSKGKFHIDLDLVDFGYPVAEIELMTDNEKNVQEATQNIIDFAKQQGIDTTAVVLGKVAKYLQMKNPAHLQALIDAGIIKVN
jgi:adenylate cyclase class IV